MPESNLIASSVSPANYGMVVAGVMDKFPSSLLYGEPPT